MQPIQGYSASDVKIRQQEIDGLGALEFSS